MATDASDVREKLAHMTGGARTTFVFEVKFHTKGKWVDLLRDFKKSGAQRALLERLPAYIVDQYHILARAIDAVGMYRSMKEYNGVFVRSCYSYWIRLTLEGVPIMSTINRQRIADGLLHALNDILEDSPVKSTTLVIS